MDHDDLPVGRILSRREALMVLGILGVGALAACAAPAATPSSSTQASEQPELEPADSPTPGATIAAITQEPALATTAVPVATEAIANEIALPACVVSPAMTEGPYFVDERLNRSDIRINTADGTVKEGVPLKLTLRVSQINTNGCAPLAGAMVDIWHCDALGVYSDVVDRSFDTRGQDFLRGFQITDANGLVNFTTIYPGWYQGRAVHIHFKVRATTAAGQNYEFTSQFFFDDALSEQVFTRPPYASKGLGFLRNANDGIYRGGGDQTTLTLTPDGDGYRATFDIGLAMA